MGPNFKTEHQHKEREGAALLNEVIQERCWWYWPPQFFLDCLVPESGRQVKKLKSVGISGVHKKKLARGSSAGMRSRNLISPHNSQRFWQHGKQVEGSAANRGVKRATLELPKENTLLKCHSWSRSKSEKKNEKWMLCHPFSIRFKEANLPLQVPTVQGNLLFPVHVRQPRKNYQVTIVVGEVKIEESSLGNMKIKIFPKTTT